VKVLAHARALLPIPWSVAPRGLRPRPAVAAPARRVLVLSGSPRLGVDRLSGGVGYVSSQEGEHEPIEARGVGFGVDGVRVVGVDGRRCGFNGAVADRGRGTAERGTGAERA